VARLNRPTFNLERELLGKGYRLIAGADEAGRGALAGPLSLGIVIYDPAMIESGETDALLAIDDSKKLTARQRLIAYDTVSSRSIASDCAMVSHRIIDRINVNRATEHALNKSLRCLPVVPDIIIMDGNFSFHSPVPIIPVRRGDSISITIASASIVAKVTRDRIISKFDSIYPGYNFSRHKGYGTRSHIAAIRSSGASPIHRRSYEPLKSMVTAGHSHEG
jgi:ribonuclease HII